MRILFTIGNLDAGGAERVVATLANAFSNKNHEIGILMVSTNESKSFYPLNESIELIPLLSDKDLSISKKKKLLTKKIDEFNPDVVVSFLNYVIMYTYFALKKANNRNIKFVVSERNDPKRVPSSALMRSLRNKIFRKADGCVFQTEGAKSYFKKVNNGVVIPNPLFINKQDIEVKQRDNIVLMVGSDKKEKNRSMAFKAFELFQKNHPEYKMVVVGENGNENELKLLDELGIANKICFAGKMNDWQKQYASAKMFILTSDFEGMPNALLEACASGIPSISTDCPPGGPREILDNGKNGILVNVDDYKSLANEMSNLANNPQLAEQFSQAKEKIVSRYNPDSISNNWINFIESLF